MMPGGTSLLAIDSSVLFVAVGGIVPQVFGLWRLVLGSSVRGLLVRWKSIGIGASMSLYRRLLPTSLYPQYLFDR